MGRLTVLGLNDAKPRPPDPVEAAERYLEGASKSKANLVDWLYDKQRRNGGEGAGDQYRHNAKSKPLMDCYTGWAFAAVDLIAKAMMTLNYGVYQYRPDKGAARRVEDPAHPFLELLNQPNPRQTESEFFYQLAATLLLSPDVAVWMPPGANGRPGSMRILDPEWTFFIENRATMQMVSYVYTTPNGTFTIPAEEVVHFRHPMEMSPMMAAARSYDASLYAGLYLTHYYRNHARPDFAIVYKGTLAPGMQDKILNAWLDKHKGPDNAFLPTILDNEAKIEPFTFSDADSKLLQVMQLTRDQIFWIFGVPPAKLDQTANRATSEAADYTFRRDTVAPMATLIAARVSQDIIRNVNRYPTGKRDLWFEFENPVPEDKEYAQRDREQRLKLGLSNRDDLRAEMGLDPLPDGQGQIYYLQSGLVPADMVGLGLGGGLLSLPALPEPGKALTLPRSCVRDVRTALPMKAPAGCTDRELLVLAGRCKADFGRVPPAIQAEAWDRHVKRLTPREVKFTDALAGYFHAQNERVQKALEASYPKDLDDKASPEKRLKAWRKKAIPELGLTGWDGDEEIELFYTVSREFLGEIFEAALGYAMRPLTGNEPDPATDRIRAWLDNTNRKYSQAVVQESEDKIRRLIAQGIAEGRSVGEVGKDITDLFEGWERWRGQRIARTELNASANAGTLEGYKQSGVVERREWLSAIDERTRGQEEGDEFDHYSTWPDGPNGEIVSLDSMFVGTGEPMEFPGDPDGSPGDTINCRCTQLPVIEGDGEE